MNRRERAILLLLTATFLVGLVVTYCRRVALRRRVALNPIAVVHDAAAGCSLDPAAPPVDLNRATQRQLDGLPGVGSVLAGRIIEYRQRKGGFRSVSELKAVSGIGKKRYAALKDLVTVGSPGVGSDSDR